MQGKIMFSVDNYIDKFELVNQVRDELEVTFKDYIQEGKRVYLDDLDVSKGYFDYRVE